AAVGGGSLDRQVFYGLRRGIAHPSERADQILHRLDRDLRAASRGRSFERVDPREQPRVRLTPRSDAQDVLDGCWPHLLLFAHQFLAQPSTRTQPGAVTPDIVL